MGQTGGTILHTALSSGLDLSAKFSFHRGYMREIGLESTKIMSIETLLPYILKLPIDMSVKVE